MRPRRWTGLLLGFIWIVVGLRTRAPYFLAWRSALPWLLATTGLLAAWRWRRRPETALLLVLAALLPFGLEWRFARTRQAVLEADPARLQALGRHFIVGVRDLAEAEALIRRGAVGGVFLTQRNIRGLSAAEFSAQVRELQAIQAEAGRPPLFIATDQEGGPVSRLSPLVPALPSLAAWLAGGTVETYAEIQARSLAALGVNLNFSPVVDLPTIEQAAITGGRSQVAKRALGTDPERVADLAGRYCRVYARFGVSCTLKHFPGLGRILVDTHFDEGRLRASPAELEARDWIPFRRVLSEGNAALMLGHVRVPGIDDGAPASLSRAVVSGLIRRDWGYRGLIVTDDFTMGPIAGRPGGVGRAAVEALQAGVDLILVSYDPDLYYEAMAEVLRADRAGEACSAPTFAFKSTAVGERL